MEMVELLQQTMKEKASDLIIAAGVPPCLRIDGKLVRTRHPVLDSDECRRLLYSVLTETQKGRFEGEKELDLILLAI